MDGRALKVEVSPGDAIRLALLARGHSLASIARDLGVTRGAVSAVVHGHWGSPRIWARIAALLDLPVRSLRGRKALTPVSVTREKTAVNVRVSTVRRRRPGEAVAEVPDSRRIA